MTIKIARNHYGSFEHVGLELRLDRDDTFVVTPEIEESKAFKLGIERKKFEFLEITDIADVQNAHGATDEMVEAVRDLLTAEPEEPGPEPELPPVKDKVAEEPEESEDKTDEAEQIADDITKEVAEPVIPTPDIDGMKYRDLQAYALELEKKYGKDIDRSVKMKPLRASIKKLLEEVKEKQE